MSATSRRRCRQRTIVVATLSSRTTVSIYFSSKIELTKGAEPTMSAWRRNLFIATSRLSTDGAEFFGLPQDRTLIEGSRIEV